MNAYSNQTQHKTKKIDSCHLIPSKFGGKGQRTDFLKKKYMHVAFNLLLALKRNK